MAKILVVDDDRDIHILCQALLAPHHITVASSVVEALDELRSQPFDLIVSDAGMPQLSGFDLLLTLKKNSVWKHIPFAMLTGKKDREDIQRAVRLGAQAYILKPLDPEVLIHKVTELLETTPDEISQLIQLPTEKKARIQTSYRAEMLFEIEVQSISNTDVTVISTQYFDPETSIKMDSPLFREIGIFEPQFRVIATRPIESEAKEMWRLQLAWQKLDESSRESLARWVSQQEGAA